MNCKEFLGRFIRNEDGLVAIEWVGIAAVAAIGAIAISGIVFESVGATASSVPTNLCTNATTQATAITTATGGSALGAPCT